MKKQNHPHIALHFSLAICLGIALYLLFFAFVARKPMSAGVMHQYFQHKIEYARGLKNPKLMLLGGSNARFSHSCAVIGPELGIPCVNAGINIEVSLDVLIERFKTVLNPGDYVYFPLSYEPYAWDRKYMDGLLSTAYLLQYEPRELLNYPIQKQLNAIFYFDLSFVFSSLAENVLPRLGLTRMAGTTRTFGIHNLNTQGDEKGHTPEQAQAYSQVHAAFEWAPPEADSFSPGQHAGGRTIGQFLRWAKDNEILVIGGLPTALDAKPVSPMLVAKLERFYQDNGQAFIALKNHSQYPRECFFDTGYHLHEDCQVQHSRHIANGLRSLIHRRQLISPGNP